ncbi:hypothetical protein Q7P37_008672 [Cladosporium fusiforme]
MNLTVLLHRQSIQLNHTRSLGRCIILATVIFLIAVLYVRRVTARDPGSWFFDPRTAYDPHYSTIRSHQAESFVVAADTAEPFHRSQYSTEPLRLCVGIPSIAREGVRYLRTTVGSLLEGLTVEERDGIHLIVFIPHSDPDVHPAYHEPWLGNLADNVLRYNVSQKQLDHIVDMEREQGLFREKGLYDYKYLLNACAATEAAYIAIFEDDIIAMDGWYHRTLSAIKEAEAKWPSRARGIPGFLYLRLFYTEEFLGWNGEDWPIHVSCSLLTIVVSGLLLNWIRSRSQNTQRFISMTGILAVCLVLEPLLIVLVFAAGKVSVLPRSPGVNVMNKYGCCSQALVFPRLKAEKLINWYEQARIGFVDSLTEQYADEHAEVRLALSPSVIQHIGRKSSKGDDFGKGSKHHLSVAEKLWNFKFELFDKDLLHTEHREAAAP